MTKREQKIDELLEILGSIKRSMAYKGMLVGKEPHITPSQLGVLMLIDQRGESSIKDIAGDLKISSSATTQLVDSLVKSGYVTRKEDPQDRRTVSITLSKKTRNQVSKMKNNMKTHFLKIFEVLNDKEFDQFILLNKKIVEGFSKK